MSNLGDADGQNTAGLDPGGGAKGAEAPPPLQVNEMRNNILVKILTHLSETSERHHCMNLHMKRGRYRYQKQPIFHIKISKMPRKAFMRISDIDFLLNGTKSGLLMAKASRLCMGRGTPCRR